MNIFVEKKNHTLLCDESDFSFKNISILKAFPKFLARCFKFVIYSFILNAKTFSLSEKMSFQASLYFL